MTRTQRKVYGYGIVDKAGQPWWDEACVSEEPSDLADACADLNSGDLSCAEDDARRPFRVVKLFWISRRKRK